MRYQTFKAFWLLLSKGKLANKMQIETLPWCRDREMIDDVIFVFATHRQNYQICKSTTRKPRTLVIFSSNDILNNKICGSMVCPTFCLGKLYNIFYKY